MARPRIPSPNDIMRLTCRSLFLSLDPFSLIIFIVLSAKYGSTYGVTFATVSHVLSSLLGDFSNPTVLIPPNKNLGVNFVSEIAHHRSPARHVRNRRPHPFLTHHSTTWDRQTSNCRPRRRRSRNLVFDWVQTLVYHCTEANR